MESCIQRRGPTAALGADRAFDAAGPGDGDAGRVLVVDDDAAARLVCAINLTAAGVHVLEARDGLDALEQARGEGPDLLLTDVKMPGLDGSSLPRGCGGMSGRATCP